MLESLFDLPLFIAGPVIIGPLCLFAIGGLLLVRRYVLPGLRIQAEDSEFSGSMLQKRTATLAPPAAEEQTP